MNSDCDGGSLSCIQSPRSDAQATQPVALARVLEAHGKGKFLFCRLNDLEVLPPAGDESLDSNERCCGKRGLRGTRSIRSGFAFNRSSDPVQFGVSLGAGVITHLHHAVSYSIVAALLVSGRPGLALGVGLVFGAVRGLVPAIFRLLALDDQRRAAAMEEAVRGRGFLLGMRLVLAALGVGILWGVMTYP